MNVLFLLSFGLMLFQQESNHHFAAADLNCIFLSKKNL